MKPRATRAVLAQLRQHGHDLRDRDRKADVRRLRADGRRDADHLPARVDQRPAAVAEADGGVRLDVGVEALSRRACGRGS